ncbi:sensor histidine kinase [Rathayibacter sp. CAU 1779]
MAEPLHRHRASAVPVEDDGPVVSICALTARAAEAVDRAAAAAGFGSAAVVIRDPSEAPTRSPVIVVAESLDDLDPEILVSSVHRDYILVADVQQQLDIRVSLLRERARRRRDELAQAEDLRNRAMALASQVHAAGTATDLARIASDGIRSVFKAQAAVVLLPADPDADGGAHPVIWVSPGGASDPDAAVADRLRSRSAQISDAATSHAGRTADGPAVEFSVEDGSALVGGLFGPDALRGILAPVQPNGGAKGALVLADGAGAPRRTSFERSLVAFVATQTARAVSELWLSERQQRTETELRTTSAELQRLVDEMGDLGVVVRSVADAVNVGVLFYDTENRPVLHNRMLARLLTLTGFDPQTGRSNHVYASDRHTQVKQGKNILAETLEGDERGLIYWIGDPRGEQRAVVTEAHTITRPDGERLGSAVVTYDVTDLANAIEIREEYLATVSHELRTPLTSIVGYLDLIDDGFDVEALGFGKEFRTIQHSAEQMLGLIRDLLSTSTSDLALRIEPIDLAALLTQSATTFRPVVEAVHQTLELHIPNSTVLVHLDRGRIKQVVDNLISNASKYTAEGGRILVRLEFDGESVVISVADNGRGISKSDQARLFDRFFRARDARDAAIQGVGIGLTIVKTIVDAHGGTVSVDSELGRGTVFTVRLPIRAQSTPLGTLPLRP